MTRDRFINDLTKGSAEMGVRLDEEAKEKFYLFYSELKRWNIRINLVSRNEPDWVRAHFLDSLAPLGLGIINGREKMIDLGSGAGFPGVPIKVARPGVFLGMAESSGRKCAWLRHLARSLELEGTQVLEGRFNNLAEEMGKPVYNLAVSRAATKPAKVVEQAGQFLIRDGRLLVYTTRDLVIGGRGKIHPYQVPGSKVPSVIWEVKY
jgi:16S rRNA (guanine527-N7)-methyltransferase